MPRGRWMRMVSPGHRRAAGTDPRGCRRGRRRRSHSCRSYLGATRSDLRAPPPRLRSRTARIDTRRSRVAVMHHAGAATTARLGRVHQILARVHGFRRRAKPRVSTRRAPGMHASTKNMHAPRVELHASTIGVERRRSELHRCSSRLGKVECRTCIAASFSLTHATPAFARAPPWCSSPRFSFDGPWFSCASGCRASTRSR